MFILTAACLVYRFETKVDPGDAGVHGKPEILPQKLDSSLDMAHHAPANILSGKSVLTRYPQGRTVWPGGCNCLAASSLSNTWEGLLPMTTQVEV